MMKKRHMTICLLTLLCAGIQIPWVAGTPSENPASATTAAAAGNDPGTAKLGEACTASQQCAAAGAVCLGSVCQCGSDMPSTDLLKCGKVARVNEECSFTQQCEAGADMTECKDGVCVCRYEMVVSTEEDGSMRCKAQGNALLGERCESTSDCGVNGAVCKESVCTCHEDLAATDKTKNCGKVRFVNESCTFDEQCSGTKMTHCESKLCRCMDEKIPYKIAGVLECVVRGKMKYGDYCNDTLNCGYDNALCQKDSPRPTCQCQPDTPATNSIDKCGKVARVNESCTFDDQCEAETVMTECREGRCMCRFEMTPTTDKDGGTKCTSKKDAPRKETYVDPTMIGVLVGMALMFIILCVVLRLFSKARWRENRTIFNTPNPRLMNVSLLRDSKLLHSGAERRGSRASVRAPSRQPSMASLRPQSPSQSIGSRRSRRSSSPSVTSTKSPKSPIKSTANNVVNSTGGPVLENVTIEIQDPKV